MNSCCHLQSVVWKQYYAESRLNRLEVCAVATIIIAHSRIKQGSLLAPLVPSQVTFVSIILDLRLLTSNTSPFLNLGVQTLRHTSLRDPYRLYGTRF